MTDFSPSLKLEIQTNLDRDFFIRAIILEPTEDANGTKQAGMCVRDIFEADTVHKLRSFLKNHPSMADVDRYDVQGSGRTMRWKSDDAWSDALRVLKDATYEAAMLVNADVTRATSVDKMFSAMQTAERARAERERLDAEREAERAAATEQREKRAEYRRDFDAFVAHTREVFGYDNPERQMMNAVAKAKSTVDAFADELAKYTAKVAENPVYALSWSGDFVQAAADHAVAQEVVTWFEAGATAGDMQREALTNALRGAKRSTSRSTSVMSNLTDDAMNCAWASMAERLTGRSLW